jgi:CBS domain-containing protein
MTAARLRLVDEAKANAAAAKASVSTPSEATAAPASKRQAVRGPGAQSEVVARSAAQAPAARPRAGKRPSSVADVMRSPAICCHVEDTLQRVAQLMWEHDVGVVVVVDAAGKALHVVTDRDVCMGAYTQGLPLWATHVRSLKPAPLVCCSSEAGVIEARKLMQEHGVRRIPVLDASGNVVGVVGLGDLIREATITAPKGRTRGLTAPQLSQTLMAVYEDVPVPADRLSP